MIRVIPSVRKNGNWAQGHQCIARWNSSMRKKKLWIVVILLLVSSGAMAPWLDHHEVQAKLGWLIWHVRGPWNPFAKKVSRCAPFAAVRWRGSVPEVKVMGTWYELLSLDDLPADDIVHFCQKSQGKFWRSLFEEDLVIVLREMGKPGHFDSETGPLTVRTLDTGEKLVLGDVPWTNANRHGILITALEAWKANGRKKDPREDPGLP
jgi:hypothetical protein